MKSSNDTIRIRGAREHNLKNVSLELPRDKLIVITGLSGSGKSSLAFDTIYAEGQRRYVESLSSYARQFLGMMEKPDVDQIDGLSPAISIDQKSTSRNPRSTVATVTEIYDYLRLLFARIGTPHCPVCGAEVSKQSPAQIVDAILKTSSGARVLLLAPLVVDRKGEFKHIPDELKISGFARVRVDNVIYDVDEFPELDKQYKHSIDVVVDRLVINEDVKARLSESLEQALDLADGTIKVVNVDSDVTNTYSDRFACVDHPEAPIVDMAPRSFSFNSPHGACPHCMGLGIKMEIDPELVIPNERLTVAEGAIRPWAWGRQDAWYQKRLAAVAAAKGFSLDVSWKDLSDEAKSIILFGAEDEEKFEVDITSTGRKYAARFEGVIPSLERRYHESESEFLKKDIEKYMREIICHVCKGSRLKPEVLAVTVANRSIIEVTKASIGDILQWFEDISLNARQEKIGNQILKEIRERLRFLHDVGLDYLTLDRSANTLSGGEAQRIRLATQIGSGLMGVLYVLDEPSIGLHQRDNNRLISTLTRLRDLGNTVIVVEHDEETIRMADEIVDVGPSAGEHGGEIIAQGDITKILANKKSLTGQYLSGDKQIPTPTKRRAGNGKNLKIIKAAANNLKDIDVELPLGTFIAVTGVSGSGKSSLINDILAKHLQMRLHRANTVPAKHDDIKGVEYLDKAITITQSPIGRTPRSNPATYTNVFTDIRQLFAKTPEARLRGYKPGRFSFNVKGGRCEICRGDGVLKIEMHFLPDVYITCEECKGQRYNREALEIHYKGKNISEVLNMTVEEAAKFFANVPRIKSRLDTLERVGLGYIRLGQPATTLSGGEAQRIKLASELSRRSTGKTFYILDEPTTGLHFADVEKLLDVLQELVSSGNTVLIIEHNLDVIKNADWLIDLGPEGGDGGGEIVAVGTPEEVAKNKLSFTGQYLNKVL
ncbi:MAG: excinuclease ABC subunit UvrA [Candidatus Saccharimonadales bacterium]